MSTSVFPDDVRRFVHRPMDIMPGMRLIRLVYVERPSTYSQPVQCSLKSRVLDSSLSFNAVSYIWGKSQPTFDILLDGCVFSVREGLYEFLKHARHHDRALENKWFWIDQLCIDQSSVVEKNHEVSHMDEIFRMAKRTIIWLAPSAMISDLPGLDTMTWIEHHPYWTRLWVIQEVILAQDLLLVTLKNDISFSEFSSFIERSTKGAAALATVLGALLSLRKKRRNLEVFDWSDALVLAKYSDCHILRDRIYGMLGVVGQNFRVDVDYTKPTTHVWTDVLLAQITHGKISHAQRRSELDKFAKELAHALQIPFTIPLFVLDGLYTLGALYRQTIRTWNLGHGSLPPTDELWTSLVTLMYKVMQTRTIKRSDRMKSEMYSWCLISGYRDLLGFRKKDIFSLAHMVRGVARSNRSKDFEIDTQRSTIMSYDAFEWQSLALEAYAECSKKVDNDMKRLSDTAREVLLATKPHIKKAYLLLGPRTSSQTKAGT
jgi:hypothetical protein